MSLILLKNRTLKPAQIFNSGQQGFWFDFVTPGVWFQDSAGTTPVDAADQPTGLILDRSKNGIQSNGNKCINLLTYSEDFANSAWSKQGSATVTRSTVLAPDGIETAWQLNIPGSSSFLFTSKTVLDTTYTLSVWVRAISGTATVSLNLYNGPNNQASPNFVVGPEWTRITWSPTIVNAGTINFYTPQIKSPWGSILIWGAQLELGSTATAYQRIDASWAATIPGNHALQSTAAARPTSKLSPSRISLDKTDDRLLITVPTGGFVGTLVLATTEGTAAYGVNIPAGTGALGANTTSGTIYFPGTTIVGAICRHGAMTDSEIARCMAYLRNIGGGPANYSGITTFANYWRNAAWLTGFVANAFNGSSATNFTNAFTGCALDQTSVDNILVSINSNGTSGGTLNLTGGTNSAPSATGAAAVTALQSRGWTVTTN